MPPKQHPTLKMKELVERHHNEIQYAFGLIMDVAECEGVIKPDDIPDKFKDVLFEFFSIGWVECRYPGTIHDITQHLNKSRTATDNPDYIQ